MASYYMAIDIGTKNGRQMIGYIENGRLQMEEVHRFDNRIISKGGEHYWDIEHLYEEIIVGLKKCWDIEKLPVLIGIGTWGSDFVLLDQENKPIRKAVAYGDERPSTIDQLKAIKEQDPECLEKAECLLFIGDYLSFLFTRVKCCEYTNANTTLLVDTDKGVWNEEIIQRHGFPRDIFIRLCPPGIMLSNLIRKVAEEIGYDCMVMRVEGNRDYPNPLITSITEKIEIADPDEVVAVGSIITMMIRGHQFYSEEEVYRCICDYFNVKYEYPKSKGTD